MFKKNQLVKHKDNLPAEQPVSDAVAVMSMLEKAVMNPEVDVEKMSKLMDMQERILDRNAKEAFARDYVRMKPHLPAVIKLKYNSHTKSYYADLPAINKQIEPILAEYGFAISFSTTQTDKDVTAIAELLHEGGFQKESTVTMPFDNKGIAGTVNKIDVHAIASAATYAKRNALCARLNISTGEKDDDGNATAAEKSLNPRQIIILNYQLDKCSIKVKEWFIEKHGDAENVLQSAYDGLLLILQKREIQTEKGEDNVENS